MGCCLFQECIHFHCKQEQFIAMSPYLLSLDKFSAQYYNYQSTFTINSILSCPHIWQFCLLLWFFSTLETNTKRSLNGIRNFWATEHICINVMCVFSWDGINLQSFSTGYNVIFCFCQLRKRLQRNDGMTKSCTVIEQHRIHTLIHTHTRIYICVCMLFIFPFSSREEKSISCLL